MRFSTKIYSSLIKKLNLDMEDSLSLYEEISNTEKINEKSSYELYNYYLWADSEMNNTLEEIFLDSIYNSLIKSNIKKILCVGDGKYYRLSLMLIKKGFEVITMDKSINNQNQLQNLTLINRNFDYIKDFEIAKAVDIIIGHHPCAGAKEIILASEKYKKPFITALCCAPKGYNKNEWYNYLMNLIPNINITYSLSGKVLYKGLSL